MENGTKKTIIWENNSEPPKNYIWVKDDGVAYEYDKNSDTWVKSKLQSGGNEVSDIIKGIPISEPQKFKEGFMYNSDTIQEDECIYALITIPDPSNFDNYILAPIKMVWVDNTLEIYLLADMTSEDYRDVYSIIISLEYDGDTGDSYLVFGELSLANPEHERVDELENILENGYGDKLIETMEENVFDADTISYLKDLVEPQE